MNKQIINLKNKLLILIISLSLTPYFSYSQKNNILNDNLQDYRQAIELFQKEKYSLAQEFFTKVLEDKNNLNSEVAVNSEYYKAICSANLFNKDAENLLLEFIKNNSSSCHINNARFNLGTYYFRKKEYEQAIKQYELTDKLDLNNNQLFQYYFNFGYSYFSVNDYSKAKPFFYEIKDASNEYSSPCKYYYAHICYEEKNYETALTNFLLLQDDKYFSTIVPYYITQLYYLQKKYDKVLEYAPALLDSASLKRAPEIARIIGEAYYMKDNYKEAIPFFEIYINKAVNVTREEIYKLGMAYYKNTDYPNAIRILQNILNTNDSLTQNAYYHIAYSYIKTDEKKFALSTFYKAYNLNLDKQITEDALFNYAKISFELSFNPFNEAIIALQNYIEKYPESDRVNEFYEYLVKIYLQTNNYTDALASLEKIKDKSDELKEAYQKIAFYKGIDLLNNKEYDNAIAHFEKSSTYPINKEIVANCVYWTADANYRKGPEFVDLAIEKYSKFLSMPSAFSTKEFNLCRYNLGYCFFQKANEDNKDLYEKSIVEFKIFEKNYKKQDNILADALLRIADCYFIDKDLRSSSNYYEKSVTLNFNNVDYALYQLGVIYDLNGNKDKDKAIAKLNELIKKYGKSAYNDDAKFLLANIYFNNKKNNDAKNLYNDLVSNYPNSRYTAESMLKLGLLYTSDKDYDKAKNVFRTVLEKYPSSKSFYEALQGLENLYIAEGKTEEYLSLTKSLNIDISSNKEDSITFIAFDNTFRNGDCENLILKVDNYLNKFSNGYFVNDAYYYRGLCYQKSNNLEKAVSDFDILSSKPKNIYTEDAVVRAAAIYYNLQKYKEAAVKYYILEELAEYPDYVIKGRIGQMRSYYFANDYENALALSDKVIKTPNIDKEIIVEAYTIKARTALKIDSIIIALDAYTKVYELAKDIKKVEAKYNMAYINHLLGEYKLTEDIAFELINEFQDNDYWVAKTFILLADNFVKQDNNFQAKHTLLSVIENHKGEELKKLAQEKYDAIVQAEEKLKQEELKEKEQKETEVSPFNSTNFQQIFNDNIKEAEKNIDDMAPIEFDQKANNKENNSQQEKPVIIEEKKIEEQPVDTKKADEVKPEDVNKVNEVKPEDTKKADEVKPEDVNKVDEVKPEDVNKTEEAKPIDIEKIDEVKPEEIKKVDEVKPEDTNKNNDKNILNKL